MVCNEIVQCPEPGFLFTRDNALWSYYALKELQAAGKSIPEQDSLLAELRGALFPGS